MIKKALTVAALAIYSATLMYGVDAGSPHVDPIDASVQFFPNGVREFTYTSHSAAHQQDPILIAGGYIYAIYYDQDGSLVIARRSATDPTDTWLKSEFSPSHDSSDPDSHRTANIAVSPSDGRLHVLWGMHADRLRYVVTKDPNAVNATDAEFGADMFEAERQFLSPGENLSRVCYPRFFIGQDNKLQLIWRNNGGSGSADSSIATYNGDKTWTPLTNVVDGFTGSYTDPDSNNNGRPANDNRNAYFNDIGFRNGKIHISWTYRENAQSENGFVTNHDLHYAYSSDGDATWNNRFDTPVVGAINLDSPGIKFKDLPYARRVDNQTGQTIDKDGGVHMLFRHNNESGQKRMFHYYKAEGSTEIIESELTQSSSVRPKIYADPTDDPNNTLYILTVANSSIRVYGANKGADNWGTWSTIYDSGSEKFLSAVGKIAEDGRTLYIFAQRRPSSLDQPTDSSALELITLPISPTTVASSAIHPEVNFVAPTDDLSVDVGYDLSVEAAASDADGTIASVALYIDDDLVREITSAPYIWGAAGTANEFELAGLDAGTYDVEVIATDNDGLTAGRAFSLTVNQSSLPEGAIEYTIADATITASTENPLNGAGNAGPAAFANDDSDTTRWNSQTGTLSTGQWLELDFGNVRTIRSVRVKEAFNRINEYLLEFWDGSAWQRATGGFDPVDDLTISLPNIETNKLRYTAVSVKPNTNGSIPSISIFTFSANAVAYAPDVELVSPTDDLIIDEGDTFSVEANVGDLDGDLVGVSLFIDSVLVRETTVAPFIWGQAGTIYEDELGGLAAGAYELSVVATDARGLTSSATFNLTVRVPLPDRSVEYLITDATVSASSERAGREAALVNDGDDTTRWNSNTPGPGQWIELDFGGEKSITSVRIVEAFGRIGQYVLEYWDGSAWQTAATGDGLSLDQTIPLPNIKTSKIRLTVVDLLDDSGSSISLFTFSATAVDLVEIIEETRSPVEDSFIRGGSNADTNYSSSNRLEVRNGPTDPSFNQMSYIKFDLSELPEEGVVRAELELEARVAGLASGQTLEYTVEIFGIPGDDWTADTLTWNNAPNHDPNDAVVTGDGIQSLGTMQWIDGTRERFFIDVADFINANIADGFASFAVAAVTRDGKQVFIDSSETSMGPSLRLTWLGGSDEPEIADAFVGWDQWPGPEATLQNGLTGIITDQHSTWRPEFRAGSADGTFGGLSTDIAAADLTFGADSNFHYTGFRSHNGNGARSIDFTVSEPNGVRAELTGFHFDVVARTSSSSDEFTWTLEVLEGCALSAGVVASGEILKDRTTNLLGDVDVDLTNLSDSTLEGLGTVTFRLTVNTPVTTHVGLDNVGISGFFPNPDVVDVRLERPFIWTRDSERDTILEKIDNNAWAATVFQGMQDRIADDLAAYEADKDAFLREIPLSWDDADPVHSTVENVVRGTLRDKLNVAPDAAILYHLTQDERYAHLGADIMQNVIEGYTGLEPSSSVGNGGWLIQNDHLKETREISIQLPIVYDYLYDWLFDGNKVYDVKAGGPTTFDWENAQFVFKTFTELTLNHGTRDNNWSVLMTPSLIHNGLALDDEEQRNEVVALHIGDGTDRQGPVGLFAAAHDADGNIWPESLQYSNAVANWSTYAMTLLDRYDPSLALYSTYPQLPNALPRIREFIYPNGEFVRFGDGPRVIGAPFHDYEMTYQQAIANGDTELAETLGRLIAAGIETGEHDRSELKEYSKLSPHHAPLQLLWYADEVTQEAVAPELPSSDVLPFATLALQRNEAADGDPAKGLMYQINGGAYVHSHASGMNMELYGLGEVLGVDPGHVDYSRPEHTRYYRNWAAHNTIIVNGASRGQGGWSNIGMNQIVIEAMEPMAKQAALSPDISFTHTSFVDDKGDGAEAKQLRTLAMIRTGENSGFYVDLFRSDSSLDSEYHDYLYHNIGDRVDVMDSTGTPIALGSDPGRYQSDVGDSYQQPGWRYFENPMTSGEFSGDVAARWVINNLPTGQGFMEMHVPGQAHREYTTVDAPQTVDTVPGYNTKTTPTLVIRKQGDAWNEPFSAVFEPRLASQAPVVQSVEEIVDNGTVVGIRVRSSVEDVAATYHIFALPEYGTYIDFLSGISFKGRFGIIIEKDNGEVTFYMGDASSMTLGRKTASSDSGEATSANIVFRPGEEPAIAANSPVTVSAIDTTVGSIDQLIFAADFSLESDPSKSHKVAIEDDVVVNLTKGSWIAFPNFDFGNGANSFSAIASNDTEEPKTLELRKLDPDGPLIGTVQIDPTGSSDSFEVFSTDALDRVNGIVDLYLVFPDGGFELVNFYFEGGVGGIGSVDLTVIEDSYIRGGGNADANYGDQDRLAVKDTGNAAFDRITYLKFDLDEIPGTDILSAELYLSGRVAEGDGDVPVNIYSINNDSWTEATLTWDSENSHASDDTNIIAPDAVLEGSITFLRSGNSIQYLDITDAVRENLEDGKLSFAVADENNYNQQTFIDSRESTGLPATIHVLYKFVPSEVGTLINAGAYDQESNLGSKNTVSPSDGAIAFASDGGWVKYSGFNFGQGASRVSLTANAASAQAGTVEFRLGSPDGELIAQVAIDPSPGSGNTFHSYAAALISSPTGLQDLYLIFVNKSQKRYSIGSFLFE